MNDYIYHQLNCGYRVKKFYGFSNYLTKAYIVLRWKEKRGFDSETVVLGEVICYKNKKEGELVNIFEDKAHSIDFCNCGSVYWGEP